MTVSMLFNPGIRPQGSRLGGSICSGGGGVHQVGISPTAEPNTQHCVPNSQLPVPNTQHRVPNFFAWQRLPKLGPRPSTPRVHRVPNTHQVVPNTQHPVTNTQHFVPPPSKFEAQHPKSRTKFSNFSPTCWAMLPAVWSPRGARRSPPIALSEAKCGGLPQITEPKLSTVSAKPQITSPSPRLLVQGPES